MFFAGFRSLRRAFDQVEDTDDPRRDLEQVIETFRTFARENPVLSEVMFSRPFADFDPAPSETAAGRAVRELIVDHVRRAVDAGVLIGDETDIAHVLFSLAQGLAAAENTDRLGTSTDSVDRRWRLAVRSVLDGLRAPRS
jgi:hypothetical protein